MRLHGSLATTRTVKLKHTLTSGSYNMQFCSAQARRMIIWGKPGKRPAVPRSVRTLPLAGGGLRSRRRGGWITPSPAELAVPGGRPVEVSAFDETSAVASQKVKCRKLVGVTHGRKPAGDYQSGAARHRRRQRPAAPAPRRLFPSESAHRNAAVAAERFDVMQLFAKALDDGRRAHARQKRHRSGRQGRRARPPYHRHPHGLPAR